MPRPNEIVRLTPGKRVLFLTRDPDLIRRQLYDGLDLRMADLAPDDLLEAGTITDYSGGDELGREIAQAKAKSSVDDDLARMKAEMNIQIKELK